MWRRLQSPARRVAYYASAVSREMLPHAYWRARRHRRFAELFNGAVDAGIVERVNYYNKLSEPVSIADAPNLSRISRKKSYYYYDLRQFSLAFDQTLRLAYEFGDITTVPPVPSVVKSRPVATPNENSVLMKLDRLRHFRWPRDTVPFEEKVPRAVWRGALNNDARRRLVRLYAADRRFDIGHVGERFEGIGPKQPLTIRQQLENRYIVSLEGNDVATNLKWVMASNALCLMPRPRYETWFMEGALVPGHHYVELREDLSDLREKVDHFERHPEEALEIIANAHAHVAPFTDTEREELISLLVLQKYFECTGQCESGPVSDAIFR
ncbi:glycosyl transferase family 90 [Nitratireductor luteus]|uniref:glycosyl transferase family 90 n=1 Tax=Nitratireductor luteus TaxID=2976980 RepID=UPI002240B0FA|nr:glycosyl transferase family 90 [Nitratireductor luteus]